MLDAAVENAKVDVPDSLIEARAKELLDQTLHSLSHQGIQKEMYLQIAGKTEEELAEEAKPDADKALRREAVLTAIVAAEGIEARAPRSCWTGCAPKAAWTRSRRIWRPARRSTCWSTARRPPTPSRRPAPRSIVRPADRPSTTR